MLTRHISAVFPNGDSAKKAVQELRRQGIDDGSIAVISKTEPVAAAAQGAAEGLAVGAGVGALFGLAAVAIPGVGPFITAGYLASVLGVTGGAAAAGAIVGGGAGLLSGALAKAGYANEEAKFLTKELEAGGVLVAVKAAAPISDAALLGVYNTYGGRVYA